jgi:hypothetical protein
MLLSLLTVSCDSDLSMQEVKKYKAKSKDLPSCKLEPKSFEKFLKQELETELWCLEQYLFAFVGIVETDRKDTLSLQKLKTFVTNISNDNFDPDMLTVIEALFQLNAMLFGGDDQYIEEKNITKMMDIFLQMNKDFVEFDVVGHFRDENNKDYETHLKRRHEIFLSVERLANTMKQAYKTRVDTRNQVKITEFIYNLFHKIQPKFISDWKAVSFLKRAFVGGQKDNLTEVEFKDLLDNASKIAMLVFDVMKIEKLELTEAQQADRFHLYEQDLKNIRNSLFFSEMSDDYVFSIHDILSAVEYFAPEMFSLRDYVPTLQEFKELIFSNNSTNFMASELYKVLDHLDNVVSMGKAYYRFYMKAEGKFNKGFVDSLDIDKVKPKSQIDRRYFNSFKRILRNYRYFKGGKQLPYYGFEIDRDAGGVFEIGLIEYFATMIAKKYGKYHPNVVGDVVLTQDDIVKIIKRISNFLVGHGIIFEERIDATGETITLLTTLFQNQSNGDAYMDVPELTELIHAFVMAFIISEKMYPEITKDCKMDSQNRAEPDCFIRNFSPYFQSEFKQQSILSDFLPLAGKTFSYEFGTEGEDFMRVYDLVNRYQLFARTCTHYNDGSEIYIGKGDLFQIFAGLISIEQSLIRFDRDRTNELSPREVSNAYRVYRPAIVGLLPSDLLIPKAKEVYQYLVKFETLPDTDWSKVKRLKDLRKMGRDVAHFGWFLLAPDFMIDRRAKADRKSYTTILKIISQQSPANRESKFDCDKLR